MSSDTENQWNHDDADAVRLTQQLREYHHRALWEEEKHFTWLHSIILAAQITVVTRTVEELTQRQLILIVLAVIGIIFVFIALNVIRRESHFFIKAHGVFVKKYNKVFPENKLSEPQKEEESVVQIILKYFCYGYRPIRFSFQIVFMIFGLIDLILLVVAIIGRV